MHEWIWGWILVLALHCASLEGTESIQASCNEDVILPCSVRDKTKEYRYIVWYRYNLTVIKRKKNDVTIYNNFSTASLGVKESLVLRQVQPNISGKYQCLLAADIGAKDAESYISLNVSECVVPTQPPMADLFSLCPVNVLEVSALLAVLLFALFCLVKIALCFLVILVCKIEQKCRRQDSGRTHQQLSKRS